MSIWDVILVGLLILAIILIFAVGVTSTIPAFVRTDFDDICDLYLKKLTTDGGLTEEDIDNLKVELTSLGLVNINVVAPSSSAWGAGVKLLVEAYYESESIDVDYSKNTISKKLTYENSTIYFGLEN